MFWYGKNVPIGNCMDDAYKWKTNCTLNVHIMDHLSVFCINLQLTNSILGFPFMWHSHKFLFLCNKKLNLSHAISSWFIRRHAVSFFPHPHPVKKVLFDQVFVFSAVFPSQCCHQSFLTKTNSSDMWAPFHPLTLYYII